MKFIVFDATQENYTRIAIMVNSCTDTIINGFMIIAMLIGFFQIRHLDIAPAALHGSHSGTLKSLISVGP